MKEGLSSMSLIHTAMLAGQLVMLGVMLFLKRSYVIYTDMSNDTFLIIVPMLAVIAYVLGNKLYESRLKMLKPEMEDHEKITIYRAAVLIRLALVEGVALLAIMAYYLSNNFLYVIIAVFLLIHFYSVRPSLSGYESVSRF